MSDPNEPTTGEHPAIPAPANGGLSPSAGLALRRLRQALGRLRSAAGGDAVTVGQAMTLLTVAERPGITLLDLAERLEMAQSSATRNADVLGSYGRRSKKGMGLLERREGADRRQRELYLTRKGARVLAEVVAALGEAGRA